MLRKEMSYRLCIVHNMNKDVYKRQTKDKIGKVNDVLIYSFWVYNKVLGLSQVLRRRGQSRYLNLSKANKE